MALLRSALAALLALVACSGLEPTRRTAPLPATIEAPTTPRPPETLPPRSLGPFVPPPPAPTLTIDRVSVRPKAFEPGPDRGAEFSFHVSERVESEVHIVDEAGRWLRTLPTSEASDAQGVSATWDGRDQTGEPVPPGAYLYRLVARRSDGTGTVWGDEPLGEAEEVLARRFTYQSEPPSIRFEMPRAGRLRLRVGLEGLPTLRTIHDFTPLASGPHEVSWNGSDASGSLRLAAHPMLRIKLDAFALPTNTVIVSPRPNESDGPSERPGDPGAPYRHGRHAGVDCHEPDFSVEFVGAEKTADGLPSVPAGEVPVRISLAPADAQRLIDARFEVMFFVDTVFLFEEEEGSNPFTYRLDTRSLPPGRHLLTVNVLSFDDHAGVRSATFVRQ